MAHVWKRVILGVAAVTLAAGGFVIVPAAAAGAPYCAQTWGSATKRAPGAAESLTAVRSGRHSCYDRLVIDVNGSADGYDVGYVPQVLTQGRGTPLSLRGGAFLNVTLNAATHDANGTPTFTPSNPAEVVNVTGYRTFRQVAFGGSFEGYTTFGVGLRARLPFRVFVLSGPGSQSRIVIDVGHQW